MTGQTTGRSRAEVITLATFLLLAFAGLAAAGLFDYSPKVTAACIALGACVAAYGALSPGILKMSKGRKALAIVLAAAVVAGAAWAWPPKSPAPPTELSFLPSTNSVTLTWDESADHTKIKVYQVFRDAKLVGQTKQTMWVDDTVQPGTEYEYTIVAISIDGGASAKITRRTETRKLSATLKPPTGLTAATVAARSVTLAWTPAPTPQDGAFSVMRDGAKIGESTQASFTDTGLTPLTLYRYSVRAIDNAKKEESESSQPLSVTTPAEQAEQTAPTVKTPQGPSAPANFRLVHGNQSSITMAWQQSAPGASPVTAYRVYRDGGSYKTVTDLSFTDTNLPANTGHDYFVRAVDAAGRESADSAHLRLSTRDWETSGPWRFTLYDRATASDQSDSLKDAIRFNGTGKPTMTVVGAGGYDIGYDKAWTQLFYYSRTGTGSPNPSPAECAAQGFTQILVATVTTDRVYCRDEDDSGGVGPISYVKCLDISHKSDTPAYVTIEVWFRYSVP